jgi:hypothetical protein
VNKDFIGNVFVEPNGTHSNQIEGCTDEEKEWVTNKVKELLRDPKEQAFIRMQRQWFTTTPWIHCHGLTPEAAVAKLTELGWGVNRPEPGMPNKYEIIQSVLDPEKWFVMKNDLNLTTDCSLQACLECIWVDQDHKRSITIGMQS